jgi:hypothetical protein
MSQPCYLNFGEALLRYTPAIQSVMRQGDHLIVQTDDQPSRKINLLTYDRAYQTLLKLPVEFERCIRTTDSTSSPPLNLNQDAASASSSA